MSGYWSSHDDSWMDIPDKIQGHIALGSACIPRRIHLIWLGGTLPAMLRRVANSWQAAHPAWTVSLWDDDAVKQLSLFNQQLFDSAPNRGFQADILRYELLYRFGGYYADVDLLCLRSVAALGGLSSFVTAQSHSTVWELNNAFIGAAAGHPVLALTMLAIAEGAVAAALAPPGLASDLSAAAADMQSAAPSSGSVPAAPSSAMQHPYGSGLPLSAGTLHPYGGAGGLHPYAGQQIQQLTSSASHPYAASGLTVPQASTGAAVEGGGSSPRGGGSDPMVTVARTGPGVFTRATMAYAAAALHAHEGHASSHAPCEALTKLVECLTPAYQDVPGGEVARAATGHVLAPLSASTLVQSLHERWSKWQQQPWPTVLQHTSTGDPPLVPANTPRLQPLPLILPANCVYPIPNTAPVGPPPLFRDDDACSAAYQQLLEGANTSVLSSGASVQATVLGTAPAVSKQLAELLVGKQQSYRIQQSGVFTVHWWAQAWKRPKAQLPHKEDLTETAVSGEQAV